MLLNIVNIISITNSRLSKDSGVGTLQLSIGIFVIMWEVTEESSCRTGTPEKGEEDSNVGAAVPLVSVSAIALATAEPEEPNSQSQTLHQITRTCRSMAQKVVEWAVSNLI